MSSHLDHSKRLQRGVPGRASDNVVAAATLAPAEPDPWTALGELGHALLAAPSDESVLSALERRAEDTGEFAALAALYRAVASRPLGLGQQVDLRCRLGRLYSVHLGEPDRAIATYRRVLDLSPRRGDVAEALERLYVTTGRWRDLSDFLADRGAGDRLIDALASELPDGADEQVEVFLKIARFCEQPLGDRDRAIEAAERALSLDPGSLGALRALSRLYREAGAYDRCLDMLDLELHAVSTDGERVAVLERMARLCEHHLDDIDRAAECMENALLIDDGRVDCYAQLEGYYRRLGAWPALADCYQRHASAAPEPAARAELWAEMAAICRDELGDAERAAWALQQLAEVVQAELGDDVRSAEALWSVLELDPDNRAADDALERIYTRRERWRELADLLARRASLDGPESGSRTAAADDPESGSRTAPADAGARGRGRPGERRVAALLSLAALFETRLGDVPAALATYQELLELRPDVEPARAALARRLRDPEHALAAARVLEPIYRDGDERVPLIEVCEVLCAHAGDAWERGELLARIAQLEQAQGRPAAALLAFERALAETPGDESVLDRMEQLARTIAGWASLAEIYARVAAAASAEARAVVSCRLGRIYRDELGAPDRAIASYRAALDLPGGAEAADALEALYVQTGRWDELADHARDRSPWSGLVDALARHLPESGAQARSYLDVAGVCERRGDVEQAIEAAERALAVASARARAPEPPEAAEAAGSPGSPGTPAPATADALDALRALYRLHHRIGAYEGCLDALERQRDATTGDDRVAALAEMARLYEHQLGDDDRAAAAYAEIVGERPGDPAARAALDRLERKRGGPPG